MTEAKKNSATTEPADNTASDSLAADALLPATDSSAEQVSVEQSPASVSVSENSSTEQDITGKNASEPPLTKSAVRNGTTVPPGSPPPGRMPKKSVGIALTSNVLVLLIVLAGGAGLYHWQHQHLTTQHDTNAQLSTQLAQLREQQQQVQAILSTLSSQRQQDSNASQQQITTLEQQLSDLQKQLAKISATDTNNWLLAQADFLVNMAARKLWSDQDTLTAAALLKSADTSLADMNDPSLHAARQAIHADIASISAINQVDYDGIILKINQLANQVDNLRLADDSRQQPAPAPAGEHSISSSLQQWRQNLAKSWQHFLDSFITIRRRDSNEQPLLAPDQDIYLRENLRARLLIAAQAVPRHQQSIYQQSLEDVASGVRVYYNTDDAATKAFLTSIDQLSQQYINMTLPDTLQSQPILQRLLQNRLRNIPAQLTEKNIVQDDVVTPDVVTPETVTPETVTPETDAPETDAPETTDDPKPVTPDTDTNSSPDTNATSDTDNTPDVDITPDANRVSNTGSIVGTKASRYITFNSRKQGAH